MSKELTEEEKQKARTLYQLLTINKEASIKYLDKIGDIIKLQDSEKRKTIHKTRIKELLDAIE